MTTHADAVLIINPTAGRGRAGREVRAVSRLLRQYGLADQTWRYTRARGDAERLAREAAAEGRELIVAVGGDGTLHEVANGVLNTDATVGLIPFGTGNDLARSVGLFGDLDTACRAVARGETRRIDVGVMAGAGLDGPRHFLVVAGLGYIADTARTVNQGIRFLSGPAAYVWGAVVTLRDFTPFHLTLETDTGETRALEAMFVAAANTEMTGGGMKICPGASVDDGVLDVCVVGAVSKPQLLYQLTQVFEGAHVNHPAVTMLRATSITMAADPAQLLWFDGDTGGCTPTTVTLLPQALPLKVPAP